MDAGCVQSVGSELPLPAKRRPQQGSPLLVQTKRIPVGVSTETISISLTGKGLSVEEYTNWIGKRWSKKA
jgi:hypothetical protein